jgi:putative DNA primase/helicase
VRGWLKHRTRELWITEGAKKALAGAGADLCIVGLMGVDGWVVKTQPNLPSEPLPDWAEIALRGRVVLLAFDSDVMTKPEVKGARDRLTAFLRKRGATVVPVYIPNGPNGEKQGLDDYIASRLAVGGRS